MSVLNNSKHEQFAQLVAKGVNATKAYVAAGSDEPPILHRPLPLARFAREAQVLAALNHPNIAAIYGIEEQAIVIELVERQSPVSEALINCPDPATLKGKRARCWRC